VRFTDHVIVPMLASATIALGMSSMRTWLKARLETFILLPDYGKAIAQQWMNILFGETVVGVVFLIWWVIANPKNPPLILIFVVAMFVAGYYVWRADHIRLMPKFEVRTWCIFHTPSLDPETREVHGINMWVQLQPRCLTQASIEECQPHLRRVQKWMPSANTWADTKLDQPVLLRWANNVSDGPPSPMTLHPGLERRFNIFSINSERKAISPDIFPIFIFMEDVFVPQKDELPGFRFDIKVIARDCPDVDLYLFLQTTDDPLKPEIKLRQHGEI
jgi:hypothetical protein